jgi:hypothetical protein
MEDLVATELTRVEMEEQLLHSMEVRTAVVVVVVVKSIRRREAVQVQVQEDRTCQADRRLRIQALAEVEVLQGGLEGLELLLFPTHSQVEHLSSLRLRLSQ